jgi:hypothetical protein
MCGAQAGADISVYAAYECVIYLVRYWVSSLDSSRPPLTVGVVQVCAFFSTLCICTVETLKNQASPNTWTEQNRIEIR